jgi:hypothetical protein
MNDQNIALPLKLFNDKVRVMNQTQKKDVVLSAIEARNLHTELFALLAQIADLTRRPAAVETDAVVKIGMDGGGFK